MEGAIVCRSCGAENDASVDFCANCGEYLRWELTRSMPAAIELEGDTPAPMPLVGGEEDQPPVDGHDQPPAGGEEDQPPVDGHDQPEVGESAQPQPGGEEPTPPWMEVATEGDAAAQASTAALGVLLQEAPEPDGDQEEEPEEQDGAGIPEVGGAVLVVRSVGDLEPEPGVAAIGAVDAGAQVRFEFVVRNAGRVVDNYDLVVAGLPEGWATVSPETVYLVPYGSGGASEQEVTVTVAPPRTSAAEARVWPFELVALSRAHGGIAARTTVGVDVAEFHAWDLTAEPALRAGRLRGRYLVTLANRGNAPVSLWLYATDPEDRLRGRFVDRMLPLSPAESASTELIVRVPRPRPVGRAVERRAAIQALPDEPDPEPPPPSLKERLKRYVSPGSVSVGPGGVRVVRPNVRMPRPPQRQFKLADLKQLSGAGAVGPASPTQVVFRQKPLIPTWLIILAALIAGLVALYLLTRNHQVKVPELVGLRSTFTAQQDLQRRGLTLNPTLRQAVSATIRPGTIVAQYPPAGHRVNKGTQVTIQVAVGTGQVATPKLSGETRAQADTTLRRHGLSLGAAEPVTAPLSWVVASQIPVAGLQVPDGTPVQVFLRAPPKTKAQLAAAAAAAAAAKANAKKVKVPAIDGRAPAAYAQALGQAGLIPVVARAVAAPAAGTLYGVSPAPGTTVMRGAKITLEVSEGIPDIAFDNPKGTAITLVDPLTGAKLGQAEGPDPMAIEPSFSPDGRQLVYRSATEVFLAPTSDPRSARVIYAGPYTYTNVTFAPDPSGTVLALDRQVEGVGELCLATLRYQQLRASCLPDDGWSLGRSISWSPNGREILAFGSRPGDPSTFGILRFTTDRPFSTNPADWQGAVATNVTIAGKGVIAAAFAPSGKRVALVSNLTGSGFRVVLVPAGDLDPTIGHALPLPACDVAWRPDGKALAVVEGDATCTSAAGEIVQVPLADPRQALVVAMNGADVAYQALDSSG